MSEEWSFEKDDFLTTTPYEALYAYHKEPFSHFFRAIPFSCLTAALP